jgi:hypothetical protein
MQLHQIPMVKSFDIIGYDFAADHYCDGVCILAAIGAVDKATVDAAKYITDVTTRFNDAGTVESALDVVAETRNINRSDERSYDQSAFPKVIFAHSEFLDYCPRCALCEEPLTGFDPKDYESGDNDD